MENPKRVTADQIMLVKVCEEEFNELYDMQIESFMPLYEKYHDEISPALESKEKNTSQGLLGCTVFLLHRERWYARG